MSACAIFGKLAIRNIVTYTAVFFDIGNSCISRHETVIVER